MKTLGINIDGVIRDYLSQFDKQYRKSCIHNECLVEMNDDFTIKEATSEDMAILEEKVRKLVSDKISLPVDSYDLLNHYKFDENVTKFPAIVNDDDVIIEPATEIRLTPQQVLEDFMYEKYPYQIFAAAEEFPGATNAVNQIQQIGLNNKLFKTVLFSTLKGQAISSTYSFLGKLGCRIKNIIFINEDYEKWDYCDAIIDVMPEVLQNKPEGKTTIKINNLYNQWDAADYSFNSVKDASDFNFLKKIFS